MVDVDVLLFNSCSISKRRDQIESTSPGLKVGIASIASYLRENGFIVKIIDPNLNNLTIDDIKREVSRYKPDVTGFSPYTVEINDAADIARALKDNNLSSLCVVGGPHASAIPKETLLEFPVFDIIVRGEGEQQMLEILENKKSLFNINNIAFKNKDEIVKTPPNNTFIDINSLPYPAWDLFDLNRYNDFLPVEPLRGCPYNCKFCFRTLGKNIRYKDPERIVDEIEWAHDKFNFNKFRFLAGTFPLSMSHAKNVFDEIILRELDITWTSSSYLDRLNDDELFNKMENSGCKNINVGVESGSQKVLKKSGKDINPKLAKKVFKKSENYNLNLGANFILGLPGETHSTIKKTIILAWSLFSEASHGNFAILALYPGTEFWKKANSNSNELELKSTDWRDFGKQAGFSLEHGNISERYLQLYQIFLTSLIIIKSPRLLYKHFEFGRVKQFLKRL